MVDCPECGKKFKTNKNYFRHLGLKHSECNDQCGAGLSSKQFSKKLDDVLIKTKDIQKQIDVDSIVYDLKIGKKDVKDLSVETKNKIKDVVLENEYLKGVIDAQKKQIKTLERQMNKCFTISYSK